MLHVSGRGESTPVSESDGARSDCYQAKFASFPTAGWKQLHDVESGATVGLCLSMSAVVDYFLVRRASDGLPRGDCRDLGEQSYALYKRGHVRDGEVAEADGHLLFTFL